MKKVLSILLIAAAAFGFYGGAVSINDVLDSKAYWEEEGKKTTKDLNTLEDGLNELKANTAAYKDGLKTYNDGLITLANGEKEYATGKETLAAKEKEYNAGVAQLAAAKKQLDEGRASIVALGQLIAGLESIPENVAQLNAAYSSDNPEDKTYVASKALLISTLTSDPELLDSLVSLGCDRDALITAIDTITNPNSSDKAFDEAVLSFVEQLNIAVVAVDASKAQAEYLTISLGQMIENLNNAKGKEETDLPTLKAVQDQIQSQEETIKGMVKRLMPDAEDLVNGCISQIGEASSCGEAIEPMGTLHSVVQGAVTALAGKKGDLENSIGLLKQFDEEGYKTFAGYQKQLSNGIMTACQAVVGNPTLLDAFNTYAASMVEGIRAFANGGENQALLSDYFNVFLESANVFSMYYVDNMVNVISQVKIAAQKQVDAGQIEYNAGKAKLDEATPQLEAGRKELAAAEIQLADGRAQLADGKKKLDQYRDGEKTLREGLATLMGTKADPGLKSIAARVGEDETFTGVDGFFNFDAGYKGLKAGRAYQDDSGVVITKELTSRAIGLGVGIGAGVVALLAAILGLLKKNKVAAVFGLIAAAVAGFGAYYVNAAGTFYSEGAGSTVGNLPMIAMCVLAGVAAIFAIANFAAPKAEVQTKTEA